MSPCVCVYTHTISPQSQPSKGSKKRNSKNIERVCFNELENYKEYPFHLKLLLLLLCSFISFFFSFYKVSLCCKVPLIIVTGISPLKERSEQYDRFTCSLISLYQYAAVIYSITIVCSTLIQPSSSLHRETIASYDEMKKGRLASFFFIHSCLLCLCTLIFVFRNVVSNYFGLLSRPTMSRLIPFITPTSRIVATLACFFGRRVHLTTLNEPRACYQRAFLRLPVADTF